MKTIHIIAIILVVFLLLLGVLLFTTNSAKVKLAQENTSMRNAFELATRTIADIQAGLDSIDTGSAAKLLSKDEIPQVSTDSRALLINRIRDIRLKLEADRKRIADLEKQMANSSLKTKGLNDMIANLKANLAEKEKLVTELSSQIGLYADSLATERMAAKQTIAQKETQIMEKQGIIETQEHDLNTIYYAFGTRKKLMEQNFITRKGGVLGIGRVSVVKKNEPEKYESFDLLETDQLTFPATKNGYSILTNQSPSSYAVEKSGSSNVLKVTDKELFRKYKFLVIEIH
jgi:uncharacterized coiled-coil protein SlyX